MSLIGDNRAPDMTVTANEVATDLSNWMKDHPVIDTEDDAREAKVYVDRGRLCIKDAEAERSKLVQPLNEQVKTINDHYRGPRSLLEGVLNELEHRVSAFLRQEEEKRVRAAQEAHRIAMEAEAAARAAEHLERERLANAESGELDVDVAATIAEADRAFAEYQKAERQAAIAERDTRVKLGGGIGRAIGLKTETTLIVVDAIKAITAMGVNETIEDAVRKSARAYKRLNGNYPPGIEVTTERKL